MAPDDSGPVHPPGCEWPDRSPCRRSTRGNRPREVRRKGARARGRPGPRPSRDSQDRQI